MNSEQIGGRLHALIDQPRQLGSRDCVTIPNALVREFYGKDLLSGVTGWSTQTGMLRAMKKAGFQDLGEAIDAVMEKAGAIDVTGDRPQLMDVGYVFYRPQNTAFHLPVLYIDGLWAGVFHTGDHRRNLMTCVPTVDKAWRL